MLLHLKASQLLPLLLTKVLVVGFALTLALEEGPLPSARLFGQGISVNGHASVPTKAVRLVVRGKLEVKAEMAGDALQEFANARARVLKTLGGLEIQGLSVSGAGLKVAIKDAAGGGQHNPFGGGGAAEPEPEVVITEMIDIRVVGLDKMDDKAQRSLIAKILDESKEAGLDFLGGGSNQVWNSPPTKKSLANPGIAYGLPPAAEIEDQAFKIALDDARARADRLARLAGVTLGPVTSIQALGDAPGALSLDASGVHKVQLRVVFAIAAAK
ncbi:MAG: SIMPL domain-containing protein [Planctomycetota bacterium]